MKKPFYSILVVALCSLLFTTSVAATPLFNFDIKVDPKSISQGSIMDIPVYMVENRNADEPSAWEGGQILSMTGRFFSGNSELISFTPHVAFQTESSFWNIYNNGLNGAFQLTSEDEQNFDPGSGGVPTEVDNAGITGRSEVKIGVLKVKIGPEIQREDDNGNPGPVEIFSLFFEAANPNVYLPWILKLPGGSHTGRGTLANAIVILKSDAEDDVDPTPTPTTDTPPSSESSPDLEATATQILANYITDALSVLSQLKAKFGDEDRDSQLALRASLRELAGQLTSYVRENNANIATTKKKFNLKAAAKRANKALKQLAKNQKKGFSGRRKRGKRALTRIQKKLGL